MGVVLFYLAFTKWTTRTKLRPKLKPKIKTKEEEHVQTKKEH